MVATLIPADAIEAPKLPAMVATPTPVEIRPAGAPTTAGAAALRRPTDTHLLSSVAHELRTPLTALVTASELLVADTRHLPAPHQRRMASVIHQEAIWLQALVENLLCAATIRAGRFHVRGRPLDPRDVVATTEAVVEPLLVQREQRLRIVAARHLPLIHGDPQRLGQALINLLANASKYSGRGTPIEVRLARVGGDVQVAVADRGPGLPAASARRLFDPYCRGAAEQSAVEGVGLGLAIVRAIVEAHHGTVGAANRRGGGARIWFRLPALAGRAVGQLADRRQVAGARS